MRTKYPIETGEMPLIGIILHFDFVSLALTFLKIGDNFLSAFDSVIARTHEAPP